MDNGDLLLLAVADVTVDGQRLEGVGVRPTIEVPWIFNGRGFRDQFGRGNSNTPHALNTGLQIGAGGRRGKSWTASGGYELLHSCSS